MLKIQYREANNNSNFIIKLLGKIDEIIKGECWGISDLDIVPNSVVDYSSLERGGNSERVQQFELKVSEEGIVFLTLKELNEILFCAETIRWGVLLCYKKNIRREKIIYPLVEVQECNKLQDPHAIFEMRMLDGDLFFLLSNEEKILNMIESNFREYVIQ